MSGFGTEKFPTTSLRLGFPTAFQNAYAELGATPRFAPTPALGGLDATSGNGLQAGWHNQKKADAFRMVLAKVQSTKNMYNRANSAPNNSPGHQNPVLGQRKFANPSAGALSGTSAREDYGDAPFHFSDAHGARGGGSCDYDGGSNGRIVGGVLRSAQGQSYGMSLLQKRIGDFERIAQAKEAFAGIVPAEGAPPPTTSPFAGELPQPSQSLATLQNVELSQLLQTILDSISSGWAGEENAVNRLTHTDSTRAFALIVRLATTGDAGDIADVLEYLDGTSAGDGIIPKLEEINDTPDEARNSAKIYTSLLEFWKRVKEYLTNMIRTVGMPYKNRTNASQAYIKTLGFMKIFKGKMPGEFIEPQVAQDALEAQRGAFFPGAGPGGGPDSDDDSPPPPGRGRGGRPMRREDTQHGYSGPGGAEFDRDDRQRFAYASGEMRTGGRPVGWSDAEALDYGEAPLSPEQRRGAEEFEEMAVGTNPGNAGPRLVSAMSPVTGEWDIMRGEPPSSMKKAMARREQMERGDEELEQKQRAERMGPQEREGLPPFLQSRSQLPSDIRGLQNLARQLNEFYHGQLPDGKGAISVGADSKPKSVKQNITRRLNLPS